MDENAHVHLHMGFIHISCFHPPSPLFSLSNCFIYHFFFFVYLHIHNFFAKKMCYFFVLFNEEIIVNLYQLYFSSSLFSS